ncbi:uncharacterized protein LOC133195096 [Saccostrea echinata]|uniref:uncharacterized protein LOC133195096 n=1 Tax=Saccostrea echinata TaxID=191078 RepID=UPI002A82D35F|nr:uncharacterized protein LOC133195096 [Saccostrea echinata]
MTSLDPWRDSAPTGDCGGNRPLGTNKNPKKPTDSSPIRKDSTEVNESSNSVSSEEQNVMTKKISNEDTNVLQENTSNEETNVLPEETSAEVTNKETIEGIHEKFKGYKELPVEHLVQPDFINLLREPDKKHVKELEEEFLLRPHNYFQLMVVNICGDFDTNYDKCHLEVIGGNHSRQALQNLLKRDDVTNKSPFELRMCLIYQDLSPDEAKYIANQHNEVRKLGSDLDLVNRATFFRYALFEKSGMKSAPETIATQTPTAKDVIRKWKKGLEICMGSISRKTLNNRFGFEMRLAQLPSEVWETFLKCVEKLKRERKIAKVSGRLLKPVDGVKDTVLLNTFLQKYIEGEINFKELTVLCNRSKNCDEDSSLNTEPEKSSDLQVEEEAMNQTQELDQVDKNQEDEDSVNYKIMYIALKEREAKHCEEINDLKMKTKKLEDKIELISVEKNKIKEELSERNAKAEQHLHEIISLREKLNKATKECRMMKEMQEKSCSKRKKLKCQFHNTDSTEDLDIPPPKKSALKPDQWDFKEGHEDVKKNMVVAIKPIRKRDIIDGEPWLALVNEVAKSKLKVSWLTGSYNSTWELNPEFLGCDPDVVQNTRVACRFNFIPEKVLPEYIIDKLKAIFKN